jgi:hypothetical protein
MEIMIEVINFSNSLPINSTPALCKFVATNHITRIFNSEKKRPRVIQLIGNVKNLIIGTTVQFKIVKRSTNIVAIEGDFISKLGKSPERIKSMRVFPTK